MVGVVGLDGARHIARRDAACRPDRERVKRHAAQDGGPGGLMQVDVIGTAKDDLIPAPAMGKDRDKVRLRAGGQEQPRLLAQQFGGLRLKAVDLRVLAIDVIADLGPGDGAQHRGIGAGDGIAAQVADRVGGGRGRFHAGIDTHLILLRSLD